ncbi:MAG: TlpA family protein disulfide reductase [Gammaproteobacteria bacterium]|nr:TlpA family protein disulfide reductase [Gammaproteobacteria bacterium]
MLTGLIILQGVAVASELSLVSPPRKIPETVLPALNGKIYNLNAGRGKVLLVNFWASWCPPCRAEMPSIWRLKQRLGSSRFEVIAINIGEDAETIKAFMPDKLLREFMVLLDWRSQVSRAWSVDALPATFVVDREGQIRYVLKGAAQWDSREIIRLIGQLTG